MSEFAKLTTKLVTPLLKRRGFKKHGAFDRSPTHDEAIYRSTRASLTAPWDTPSPVPELASSASDGDPEVSDDGHTLMMSSDRLDEGDPDIFVSTCDVPR